jgi:YD repeat-containing protein
MKLVIVALLLATNYMRSCYRYLPYAARSIFLFILVLGAAAQAYAQMELGAQTSIQSANAASLGKFGDIPVSLFTGSASISIPITSVDNGPIKVPVLLQYDAGGCRLDEHPGWVGLKWSLQAGGVIKRQANGMFDEYRYSDQLGGYLDHYSSMAVSNWNTLSFVTSPPYYPDRYPDEFTFNFNGIAGSFMLNHEGKWVVRSKDNLNLKISHEIRQEFTFPECDQSLPRVFTKFTITTNDGMTYIFGGDLNAIEISASSLPSIVAPWMDPPTPPIASVTGYQKYIQTSAWHLSEIISPSGHRVKFNYARGYDLQQATYTEVSQTYPALGPSEGVETFDMNLTNKYAVLGSYLESITTNNDIVCTFSRSASNELKAAFKEKPVTKDRFMFGPTSMLLQDLKLDTIGLKVNNTPVRKFAFSYIEKPAERLKLREIKALSPTGDQTEFSYKMEYNTRLLPDYNTGQEDHWGYYNGTNFFPYVIESDIGGYPDVAAYYQSREPNRSLMDAEMISKLIYPTGGWSEFYFEPHEYAAVVRQDPAISLQSLPANKTAGGLRIKMIRSYDALTDVPLIKEYFYVKDYNTGGTVSSGILAGEPKYYEEYVMDGFSKPYRKFSSLPLNYLNTTNGNHITYTQVTEKTSKGYTTYLYSNHDNGYLDKPAFVQKAFSPSSNYFKKLYGKLDLERGLLLSTRFYAQDNFLQKEIVNTYNQDSTRYNTYVRAIHNYMQESGGTGNMIAFPIYTFYPYLAKEISTEYPRNGSPVSTEISYTYDPVHLMMRTTTITGSDGAVKRVTYKYPPDYAAMPAAPAANEVHDISALVAGNVVNTPVEVVNSVVRGGSEFVTGGKITHYENLKPERLFELETDAPIALSGFSQAAITAQGFTADARYKEKVYYSRYDDRGNPQEMAAKDNLSICYLWAYNKTYPVAKIVNATYAQVAAAVSAASLDNLALSYNDTDIRSLTQQIRTGLPGSQVHSYTFRPLTGMISETSPNNITTTYEYDNFGRLSLSRDETGKILRLYDYSYLEVRRLSLSHSSLDFGNVTQGHSASQNIIVNNTGSGPFTISSLTVPTGYSYTINGPATVPVSGSVSITITFTPTAGATYSGTVTIVSDASGPNTVAVTGTGTATRVISISGSLAFGTAYSSGMAIPCRSRPMTITNNGTAPLTVTDIVLPSAFRANWKSGVIPPGGSQSVTISFCPPAYGSYSGTLNVVSDKTDGTSTVPVSGTTIRN